MFVSQIVSISLVLAGIAGIAAVSFGICSYFCEIGPAKGRFRFVAYCFFGSVFTVLGIAQIYRNFVLPVYRADGVITFAKLRSSNRSYRTDVLLRTESSDVISLNASGRSNSFRVGEHAAVKYQGSSGAIIRVDFTSAGGKPDGVFTSGLFYVPLLPIGVSFFVFFAARRQYKNDPLGERNHRGFRRRAGLPKVAR
jgi:hypothetical protein